MNNTVFFSVMAVFIAATLFLGWYGYRNTKDNDSFLLGRQKTNPMIIALSYGAAFLSASAIVGFGGQAATYGMSLMWLVFLNLFMGLVVAFLVFGKRTRRLGRKEGAFTFSDFLGKRFRSPAIRSFSAVIILVGMPVYCAAVLLGGVNFISTSAGLDKNLVLLVLSLVVAVYVTYGGIIAVMYNDALQAGVMFLGMAVILVFTYSALGGVTAAHEGLTGLWDTALAEFPKALALESNGMNGWTSFSSLGSNIWLTVVTTFLLGVGIGALTQPQLVVRFMSAKSDRDLNRSLIIGSIFMIVIVGTAYTVGALSNLYYYETYGTIPSLMGYNVDQLIPMFVTDLFSGVTFGDVFVSMFVLAIVCASISTMSALLHTMGVSGGYDLRTVYAQRRGLSDIEKQPSLRYNRIWTILMMVVVVILAYVMPNNIIAKATSIFMGFTAATLLVSYAYSLYSERPDKRAAFISITAGGAVWVVWGLLFCSSITNVLGYSSLIAGSSWALVDPLILALPASLLALVATLWLAPHRDPGDPTTGEAA